MTSPYRASMSSFNASLMKGRIDQLTIFILVTSYFSSSRNLCFHISTNMSIHLVMNSDLRIKMLIISQFYKLIIALDLYNPSL